MASVPALFVLHCKSFIHILVNTTDDLPADVCVWTILLQFNSATQTLMVYFFPCLLKGHSPCFAYSVIYMKKHQADRLCLLLIFI